MQRKAAHKPDAVDTFIRLQFPFEVQQDEFNPNAIRVKVNTHPAAGMPIPILRIDIPFDLETDYDRARRDMLAAWGLSESQFEGIMERLQDQLVLELIRNSIKLA
jgi:hypothetical protein